MPRQGQEVMLGREILLKDTMDRELWIPTAIHMAGQKEKGKLFHFILYHITYDNIEILTLCYKELEAVEIHDLVKGYRT